MQLRYKNTIDLKKVEQQKAKNGAKVETYIYVKTFSIQKQELTDEVSASIYGADITSMIRITSIRNELEKYLKEKVGTKPDNISKYYLFQGEKKYKIKSVKLKWVDLLEI